MKRLSPEQKFAKFQSSLRHRTDKKIRTQLKERGEESKQRLLEAFQGNGLIERRRSVAEFALVSMAKQRALRAVSREFDPGWIQIARMDLDTFIGEDPDERGVLNGSIFYSDNLTTRQRLDAVISSRIRPRGDYDDRSFIAGVALGKIVVDEHASRAFIESNITAEIE